MTGWTIVRKGEGPIEGRIAGLDGEWGDGRNVAFEMTVWSKRDLAEAARKRFPPETRNTVEVVPIEVSVRAPGQSA